MTSLNIVQNFEKSEAFISGGILKATNIFQGENGSSQKIAFYLL